MNVEVNCIRQKQKGLFFVEIKAKNNFQNMTHILSPISSSTQQKASTENKSSILAKDKQFYEDSLEEIDPSIIQPSSEYLFLKNVWGFRYESKQSYDVEDHIDRINKVVAIVRMRTNYMTKKEMYLYEKSESDCLYIYQNPTFMKVKEELERMTMKNEELAQKCSIQEQNILRLQSEKSNLLENLTSLKKKYQQLENNLIEVSKKNICFEQDSLALKSRKSNNKLNALKENTDFNRLVGLQLRRPTSFCKLAEQQKKTQKSKQASMSTTKNLPDLPLQKIFIDIRLNLNSKRQKKQEKSLNHCITTDSQNEQNYIQTHNTQNNTLQKLALCRSERLLAEQSPTKLRYIRNYDRTNARKSLLSAARSVDLIEKTSLNKPKFERTKPNYQHLISSVKKNGSHLKDANVY